MGLYINLSMGFGCSRDEWADIWDGTFDILKRFPITLCRIAWQDTPYGERIVLTDDLRTVDGAGRVYWKLEGDMESRQLGETFTLYRDLEFYSRDESPARHPLEGSAADDTEPRGYRIWWSKTQGYPFHYGILAAGMYIESRCPKAYLWGDITLDDCDKTRDWLNTFLPEPVPLPLCMDAARLWSRLEEGSAGTDVVTARFSAFYQGPKSARASWMLQTARDEALEFYAARLARYSSLAQWGPSDTITEVVESMEPDASVDTAIEIVQRATALKEAEDADSADSETDAFSLVKLLSLLVGKGITQARREGGEGEALDAYLRKRGTIEDSFAQMFMRLSGVPTRLHAYMDENELLRKFIQREPQNEDAFRRAIAEANQKLEAEQRQLEKFGEQMAAKYAEKEEAEREALDDKAVEPVSDAMETADDDRFGRFIAEQIEAGRSGFGKIDENIAIMGKTLGNPKLHDEVGRAFPGDNLDAIKICLTRVFTEREFVLKESVWAELDKSTNAFLLTCFFILGTIPSSEASTRDWTLFLLEHPQYWPALEDAARKARAEADGATE